MSSVAKLHVIAMGSATTLMRLKAYAISGGIDLTGFSKMTDVVSCLQQEHFDVILIDSLHAEASSTCRVLAEMSYTPIALLVRETEANWKLLCSWDVDGFISDESSKIEMVARVIALARRIKRLHVTHV